MRFPIYSVASNPSIDQPILRKKIAYIESLLSEGSASWINEQRKELGVFLRSRFALRQEHDYLEAAAGSGFDSSWNIRQSGFAGPFVWQLKTQRASL